MKLIKREYLKDLIDVIGTPDIKIITGVRRSGKSKLLEMFKNYIIENIKNYNIIGINFNLVKFDNLRDYISLNNYIEKQYIEGKNNFVLIDEVQMCKEFERTINSLHAEEKFDIYITGSNAFLLSSDLATLFTGRTYEIQIYPFSFKEFIEYFKYENIQDAFEKYVLEGGMSGSYIYNDVKQKYNYINEVYNALIVRDIQQKYNIQNIGLMDSLTEFLMDNVSNLTSYRKVANKLNENNINTNDKTISNYINYLCDTFAFYKIRRYDIQGKRYLSSVDKYYLVDQTFKYAKLGTKNMNYGRIYENIVAIELLRRGYEVYVGELYNAEIDFVAMKMNEKIYIQVSDNISDDKTFEREVRPLLKIKDAYPKMIISRTRHEDYQYEGIQIYDLANWLLK
jgi:predicted AAA+ superfamily ATPase